MSAKNNVLDYILVQVQVIRLVETLVQLEFSGTEFVNTRVEFHPKS